MKPGYRTTEFWLIAVVTAFLLGIALAVWLHHGATAAGEVLTKPAWLVAAYAAQRGLVKVARAHPFDLGQYLAEVFSQIPCETKPKPPASAPIVGERDQAIATAEPSTSSNSLEP